MVEIFLTYNYFLSMGERASPPFDSHPKKNRKGEI
jgi:hypothetical protein